MLPHSAMNDTLDGLVIGDDPAGLTAAIYLAWFHLRVLVVDRGGGRAQSIPKTHNHAGFLDRIVGADLVANMARQARKFGARIECNTITALRLEAFGFVATTGNAKQRAKPCSRAVSPRASRSSRRARAMILPATIRRCPRIPASRAAMTRSSVMLSNSIVS